MWKQKKKARGIPGRIPKKWKELYPDGFHFKKNALLKNGRFFIYRKWHNYYYSERKDFMKILLLLPFVILSCTSNSDNKKTNTSHSESDVKVSEEKHTDRPVNESPVDNGNCYWQIMERDTFVASFSKTGDKVSGKLTFDNYEKDGSSGTVTGVTSDGIMKLWYTFQSEGMKSVMEVWFKKEGDQLLRGTGEMSVSSDSSFFSNPAAINFNSGQALKKVSCKEVPEKYK
jgi:hypothetical protein